LYYAKAAGKLRGFTGSLEANDRDRLGEPVCVDKNRLSKKMPLSDAKNLRATF
jgi:hypothetical protein